jgi:drug/metabolite transporter (DMT)-like permease
VAVVGIGLSATTSPAIMKLDGRLILYTCATLVAFAGNSVLTRLALGRAAIDATSFSTIRLAAGAAMLLLVTASRRGSGFRLRGSWTSAGFLFLYAVPFSFAYVRLTAGTGALILFGAVQATMMLGALWSGERPHALQWLGLCLALAGLVYLVLPGLAAPSPLGSASMALAGIAWGAYSLDGRGAANPLEQTTSNFVRAVPLVLLVSLAARSQWHVEWNGFLLALACGAVTSGLGYVLWYAALKGLTAARAAVVQLPVPILAGAGGVLFLGETVSARLVISAIVVLGGIGLALAGREGSV